MKTLFRPSCTRMSSSQRPAGGASPCASSSSRPHSASSSSAAPARLRSRTNATHRYRRMNSGFGSDDG
eukprot:612931-Prymnesium_polylepis.1